MATQAPSLSLFTFLLLVSLVAKCLCGSASTNSTKTSSSTAESDKEGYAVFLVNIMLPTMFTLVAVIVLGYCCYCFYQAYVQEQKHKQLHQRYLNTVEFTQSATAKSHLKSFAELGTGKDNNGNGGKQGLDSLTVSPVAPTSGDKQIAPPQASPPGDDAKRTATPVAPKDGTGAASLKQQDMSPA